MSLSDKFNAGPERKAQLQLLETALGILSEQKAASHEDRSMHGDIAEVRKFLWEWHGIDDNGNFTKPNTRNPDLNEEVRNSQAFMSGLQGALVGQIAQSESKLLDVMNKIFGGDTAKLQAFYADATALQSPKSQKWMDKAAEWFDAPAGVALDKGVAITAAAVKFAGPQLVEKQVAAINAMIDDGKLSNKAKRIVWQVSKSLPFGNG